MTLTSVVGVADDFISDLVHGICHKYWVVPCTCIPVRCENSVHGLLNTRQIYIYCNITRNILLLSLINQDIFIAKNNSLKVRSRISIAWHRAQLFTMSGN